MFSEIDDTGAVGSSVGACVSSLQGLKGVNLHALKSTSWSEARRNSLDIICLG